MNSEFARRLLRQRRARLAGAVLLVVVSLGILSPWIAPHDPLYGTLTDALKGPSSEFWLGTDDLGRDVLSRLLLATRVSLIAALQAVALAFGIGVPVGLLSGYFSGGIGSAIMYVNDAIMSFPGLVLAVVIVGMLGPSLTNAMIAIGTVYAPRVARVVRGSTLSVREENYVRSAAALGCSTSRIIIKHVLPNVLSPIIVQLTIMMGLAILAEASLSFLGLGVRPPTPSWGAMLGRGLSYFYGDPTTVIAVGIVVSLVVLCLNSLGDAIRDALGQQQETLNRRETVKA